MKFLAVFTACLLAIALPTSAAAAILTYVGLFSGGAEVPPVASPGNGEAAVTIDTTAKTMRVQFDFQNLIADTTVAHIHCCAAPTASPATGVPSFAGFPVGVNFGIFDRTFDLNDAATWNPAFVAANGGTLSGALTAFLAGLNSGLAYANIHTKSFPAGEIRADLTVIPVPGAIYLFAAGLGLLFSRKMARR